MYWRDGLRFSVYSQTSDSKKLVSHDQRLHRIARITAACLDGLIRGRVKPVRSGSGFGLADIPGVAVVVAA
jgi:hypothetical protein